MKYFNTLPKVVYRDENNISKTYTNLMARANFIQSLSDNVLIFYQYDIKDEDTPEIIAHKYYGDINRFWIVLYCNQIMDPQWDWPLSSKKFENYLLAKYDGALDNIHHYEKITTKTNRTTNATVIETDILSEEDYDSTPYESNNTYTIGEEIIDVKIVTKTVTNYEYEIKQNEAKRSIKLLNKNYATELEKQLMDLMV